MEIRDVTAIPLEHPLEDGGSFGSSRGKTATRTATLVRLETADGAVGWGEAFAPPRTVATLIEEVFADAVVGLEPYDAGTLSAETLMGRAGGYHFGRSAFVRCALSGIDTALWDLRGKLTGEPVYRILGGSRETVVPYASTMYVTEWGQDPVEPIERAVDEDFTAAKIKIGRNREDDLERVATARELLGDDAFLMVDFNGNLRPKQAVAAAEALEPYDLTWIEEPVPPENESGYEYVRERIDAPIAAGEAHFSRSDFTRLIEDELVDIVQPNLGRCGGLSEAQFIGQLAETRNVAVRPHVWNSGVGVAAALQFAASGSGYPHSENIPEPFLFEFDRSENPLRHDVLVDPFDPTGGELAIPDGPGLGIEVDEPAVESYRI